MVKQRTKCEKFSRSMGYYRPVEYFNTGKKQEFDDRKTFKEKTIFSSLKKLLKIGG